MSNCSFNALLTTPPVSEKTRPTFLSHQSKDHQESSDSECGADRRAVEEEVGEREGEEQDAEDPLHLAGDRAQPLEER